MRSMRVLPAMLRSARTLTRGTVSALLLAGCGAGLAAQNLPPSNPGFPIPLNGHGTLVGGQPLIANLGLTADGTKQIIFGTNKGELHVIYKNGSGVWGEAPGFPVSLGAPINSSPAVRHPHGNARPRHLCRQRGAT